MLQLGINRVEYGNLILEELGAESADIVNIIAAVEAKFNIFISEEDIANIRTIQDLCHQVQKLKK